MNRGMRRSVGWLVLGLIVAQAAWAQGPAPNPAESKPADGGVERLVVVRGARLIHRSDCTTLRRVRQALWVAVPNLEAARSQGYQPCVICKPAVDEAGEESKGTEAAASAAPAEDGALRFSRDIAPILVANCAGCHNAKDKARRNNFDLTTFNSLRRGGDSGDPITPGKPDESLIIKRVYGDGVPKMPPGQRDLAEETIAKLSRWVSEGARLDAGIGPEAQLSSYAPTPEEMRRAELSRLSAEDRDKQVEAASLDRWKKSGAETPTISSGSGVLLFSHLPEDRAEALIRTLDAELKAVRSLLGPVAAPALSGPEKISVYVFNDPLRYIEFVRSVENREVETGAQAHGNLGVQAPYIAAVDPLKGEAEPTSTRKAGRTRASANKGQGEGNAPGEGAERSLAGHLCEAMGAQSVQVSGKPPRWLVLGLGAYLGSRVEPRSPYYAGLRRDTMELYRTGWMTRITEVLGDRDSAELARAAGFSLLEWLGTTWRPAMPSIVRGLTRDGNKFDEVFQSNLRASREQVLQAWGGFVATRYGRGR